LGAVLQETLRLMGPATNNMRQAKDETVLGKYVLPKGAWLMVGFGIDDVVALGGLVCGRVPIY
jgi:cytochrome P450